MPRSSYIIIDNSRFKVSYFSQLVFFYYLYDVLNILPVKLRRTFYTFTISIAFSHAMVTKILSFLICILLKEFLKYNILKKEPWLFIQTHGLQYYSTIHQATFEFKIFVNTPMYISKKKSTLFISINLFNRMHPTSLSQKSVNY